MNIKQYPLDAAAVGAALPQLDMPSMADEHGMEKRRDFGSSAEDHEGDVPDLKEKTAVAPTDERVQAGVEQAAAITQTWTKNSLRMAYLFMWMTYAVNAFQSSITGNLAPFITSSFQAHSLIPTISIVSNILSAVAYMVVAKVLNLWDRTYGFVVMAVFATIGLILSATCTDIYTYCAAQCFYSVGFIGIIFAVDVITVDTSTLRDRGFAFAFTASPWIICSYAGAKISEKFHETNWRWAYGCFAIILPFVVSGLVIILQLNKRKAVRAGMLVKRKSDQALWETTKHYFVEFDVIGIFLIAAGLSLFLLPFSIAGDAAQTWRSAHIIIMLVLGVVFLASFGVYEKYWSPRPFIPFNLLVDRTVIGACLLGASWQIAYYCWYSYFTSYLQVVYDISVAQAGYIGSIYDVVAGIWLLPVGYGIRRTGQFKWFMLAALPFYTIGEALLIRFRQPGNSIGWIVFSQILIAIGGGTFTVCQQVSVTAASNHNDAAAALAMLGLFGYFGGAIGNSISGAIWTNTFPQNLAMLLPEESLPDLELIYSDLEMQLSYEIGSATRTAIMEAYAITQKNMLIAGTAILAVSLGSILLVRNIRLDKIEQVKGVLF